MDLEYRRLTVLFLLLALITACAAPSTAPQAVSRVYRMGYLGPTRMGPIQAGFLDELGRLGYVVDQNLTIEFRWAEGKYERLPELAREMAALKLDAIFANGEIAAQPLLEAGVEAPIVMTTWDAVAAGLVARTLNRPDRNITGITCNSAELGPKQLQLLREAVPSATTVAVLWNPSEPVNVAEWNMMQDASAVLGARLLSVPVRQLDDLEAAFVTARQGGDALCVMGGDLVQQDRQRVVQLAAEHRLPAIYAFREFVAVGGLMSYGTNLPSMYRRAASQMDRILKGAKPSDLPVEQPTSFDLVINTKTATALGITLPEALNDRVTEVIR